MSALASCADFVPYGTKNDKGDKARRWGRLDDLNKSG